ncbi:MAG: DNA cytosine methyltransferase [Mesorhizobium sp.]|nr:MAG: DNA cytosine methyltransferase [Mesorhizobium sp.]
MTAYALYNEIDDYAADWLENLIKADLIAPGIVDRRSIEDLRGDDLRGFRQVHFFAGIGVWSYGLRRAGVSDDTALWTGSCPCQPFSAAGQGGGVDDERHLWPAFLHLIRECRPERVLGEQVASKDGLGWLDLVQTDMEAEGYAIGALDTCSAGSGAPHIRQRLRFFAYNLRPTAGALGNATGEGSLPIAQRRLYRFEEGRGPRDGQPERSSSIVKLGHANGTVAEQSPWSRARPDEAEGARTCGQLDGPGDAGWLDNNNNTGLERFGGGYSATVGQREGSLRPASEAGELDGLADSADIRFEWSGAARGGRIGPPYDSAIDGLADACRGQLPQPLGRAEGRNGDGPDRSHSRPGPTNGFWRDADWVFCRDEKWRPIRPGSFPLVDGTSFRVDSGSPYAGKSRQGMLKAFGNAIDAEATIDFINACLDFRPDDGVAAGSLDLEDLLV